MKTKTKTKTRTKTKRIYYKLVLRDANGKFLAPIARNGFKYQVRKRHTVIGALEQCQNGFHVALPESIRYWCVKYGDYGGRSGRWCPGNDYRIFEVEISEDHLPPARDRSGIARSTKICARSIKLLRQVTIAELQRRGHWMRYV